MWTEAARERCRDDGRRTPSDLTDAEWQTIEPVLHGHAMLTVDLREMLACLYLEKAGCPWRYLPPLAFHALRARNLGQLRPGSSVPGRR